LTTEYQVLPSTWYSAEPSSRTYYPFSPAGHHIMLYILLQQTPPPSE